jgi:antitoxin FitA
MGILVDISDDLDKRLRLRATQHGHSVEEEVQKILKDSLSPPPREPGNLYDQIREDVERLGGGFEFNPLPRYRIRQPPDFTAPEFDHLNEDDRT